jgi:hypothetical protein
MRVEGPDIFIPFSAFVFIVPKQTMGYEHDAVLLL